MLLVTNIEFSLQEDKRLRTTMHQNKRSKEATNIPTEIQNLLCRNAQKNVPNYCDLCRTCLLKLKLTTTWKETSLGATVTKFSKARWKYFLVALCCQKKRVGI